MKELLEAILKELQTGGEAVLVTIVARNGSAPRGVGTAMVVSGSGEQTGTVGGGSMEFIVKTDALEILTKKECALRAYEIHTDEKSIRSGSVQVLFRSYTNESDLLRIESLLHAIDDNQDAFLICELTDGCELISKQVNASELCKMTGMEMPPDQTIATGEPQKWLIEPLKSAPRVVLFGGGHVAQVMARQLALLELRIWVVEDRPEFADSALFPGAERVLLSEYENAAELVHLSKDDHVIVMSRGHETDYQILRWVLRSDADYIGCIGSKRKITLTKERLLADGVSEQQLDRLHAPIGLKIGAETPAEIAVSVAAELIQYQANKH